MSTPAIESDMPTAMAVKIGFRRSCQIAFDVGNAKVDGPSARRRVKSTRKMRMRRVSFLVMVRRIILCFR